MPGQDAWGGRGQDRRCSDRPAGSPTATPAPNRGRERAATAGAARADTLSPRLCSRRCAAAASPCWPTSCCGPLLAFIAIKQVTPRYTAVGTLIYEPSEYKVRELQSILQSDPTTEAVMASQAEILPWPARRATRGGARQPLRQPEFNPALRPRGHLQRSASTPSGMVPPHRADAQRPGLAGPPRTSAATPHCWRCRRRSTRTR